jgi:hypothetical protein
LKDIVPSVENIDYSVAERSNHFLDLVQQAEQAGDDIFEESYHGNRKDIDAQAYPRRESHRNIADAVQIVRSSVDCLMRLLPTIERTLAFA